MEGAEVIEIVEGAFEAVPHGRSAPTSPDLRRYLDEQAEYIGALMRQQRDAR